INVIEGEPNLGAGLLPAGLLRGSARKDADNARAPVGKDGLDGPAESCAVGQQENDRGDTPRHTEHSQRSAAPVVTHGAVGLYKQIFHHGYSCLSASTGCKMEALRAG